MPDRSVSLPMSKNTGSGWREKSSGQRREKQRETEVKGVTTYKCHSLVPGNMFR